MKQLCRRMTTMKNSVTRPLASLSFLACTDVIKHAKLAK